MPLVSAKLISGLTKVFKSEPASGALAAKLISVEYDLYCKTAMAAPALPLFMGIEATAMEGILAPALASYNGSAPILAQAFADAITTYWFMPPVAFTAGPVMGMVTAIPGAKAVIPALTAGLSNQKNTNETAATLIGTQLDIATKTCMVTFTMPPPPAGPPPPAMLT